MKVNRRFFNYDHLPEHLKEIAEVIHRTVAAMDYALPESDEKEIGIRKLLEAKDCLVRAALLPKPV